MEPRAYAPKQSLTARRILLVGALGGMVAGMMMALVEMLYGWASEEHTFWDAPMAIWAWVAGLDWFGEPGEHIGSIILGMGGHMMNSMMIGVIFAAIMAAMRLRNAMASIVLGVAYGLGIWALMRYLILPLNAGEDDLFTTDLVSPQWVWWLAHAALGMTAGTIFYLASTPLRERPGEGRPVEIRRAA